MPILYNDTVRSCSFNLVRLNFLFNRKKFQSFPGLRIHGVHHGKGEQLQGRLAPLRVRLEV
jgi:hypothetical protein